MLETLLLFVVVGGPLVIGAAIAYALITRRSRSTGEKLAQRQATRRLYEEDEEPAPAPIGEVLTPQPSEFRRQAERAEAEKSAGDTPAIRSLKAERRAQAAAGSELEEGLEDTFPASDPVSATTPTTSGGPRS